MHNNNVRVRFAPSPTGHLHIGGLRTALFNWLFARHNKGTYVVRIEDTDIERSRPEYTQSILNSLAWSNLEPDEPVVTQTDFIGRHKELIQKLVSEGKAYKCYCPGGAVENEFIKYDKKCRLQSPDNSNKSYVVRIKLPDQDSITFDDIIRGPITFAIDQLDDFIIARSDGTPIYNFVVVADDAAMHITHVIRGEDHISNTPKQIVLYHALGYKAPLFAHVPLILNEQGARLSKRDAATSVLEYKELGILPDALCNYLVRLGWSHGDQEIFTRAELVSFFTLDGVGKKGSVFDMQKLKWTNGVYIRQSTAKELCDYMTAHLDTHFMERLSQWSGDQLLKAIDLYKERIDTLKDLMHILVALHDYKPAYSQDMQEYITHETKQYLSEIANRLGELSDFNAETIKELLKVLTKQLNIKLVAIAQPIRLALTGTISSPGVFDVIALLGKQESLKRIKAFISCL